MMKTTLNIILILIIMAGLAIAESYVDSQVAFKVPIRKEQQNDTTVKTTVGKEFLITLDANATTGYEWQLATPIDDNLIKLVSSEYVPDKTDLVGSGGKSIWTFKAIRIGKAQIFFKYIRSWEKEARPAKEAGYLIDIN